MHIARLASLPSDDPSSDVELIPRILGGDRALYAVLMRRYNQRLFRVIRAIVRRDDEAEDVVQQAYVTAYDKLVQFRGDASFGTWLTKIAVHEAYGRIRKATRQRDHLEVLESESEPVMSSQEHNPEEHTQRRETARLIERQVDDLPDSLRVVFMMRDVEELNTAETAAALGISEEAVRVRLHRARAAMRERLTAVMGAAPDAFHFAGERCDRIVLGVVERLGI